MGFVLCVAGFASALVLVGAVFGRPAVVLNTTPSEPLGLYALVGGSPAVGQLVSFKTPPTAFPYADRRLGYLRRTTLLKGVAAGPGDFVCTSSGRLRINGRDLAPVARVDSAGVALPRWIGCRRLGPDEFFAFSDRRSNSFDSRYFGPVDRSAIVGVYTPLLAGRGGG